MKWPGRHYHRVYGYPIRWAILAELAWRLEHWWPTGPGYRWRKSLERKATHA